MRKLTFYALILVAHVYICFDKRSGWFLLLKLVFVCSVTAKCDVVKTKNDVVIRER